MNNAGVGGVSVDADALGANTQASSGVSLYYIVSISTFASICLFNFDLT